VKQKLFYGYFSLFSLLNLQTGAQQPRLVLPIGHSDWVSTVALSPDGKKIITGSRDNTAKVWDVRTGKLLLNLIGHKEWVISAAFSPDGKKIITGSFDSTIKVWELNSGKILIDIKEKNSKIKSAAFSSDGKKILTASLDNAARLWDAASGKLLMELKGHTNNVWSASYSPEGSKILTYSEDGTAKIWSAISGQLLFNLNGHSANISSASFSSDGKRLVTASSDKICKVWDMSTGQLLYELKGHTETVYAAVFTPDGNRIISVSLNGVMKDWDANSGTYIKDLKGHTDAIWSINFSSDGSKIVTASNDKTAKVWDIASGQLLTDIKEQKAALYVAIFNRDGRQIITAAKDGSTKIWNAQTGSLVFDLKSHTKPVKNIAFHPDGQTILTTTGSEAAKIWSVPTLSLLPVTIGRSDEKVLTFAFSPGGEQVATTSRFEDVKIRDTRTGRLETTLEGTTSTSFAVFSPDGRQVVTTTFEGAGIVWNPVRARIIKVLEDNNTFNMELNSATFSTDGKMIILTSPYKKATFWDTESGNLLGYFTSKRGFIQSILFSPDGQKVITTTGDDRAEVWDTKTFNVLKELSGHKQKVNAINFCYDGSKVITASADNTAKIWDINTNKQLLDLKGHTASVNQAVFSRDGLTVVTVSQDNTCKVWNTKNGELNCTFFAVDSTDYFVQIPSGYYKASAGATKLLHYVTQDLKVISFEQLDVKYNRPDKVLEAIGNADTALIKSYRKAWEKRIKKLGIDTTQFRDGYSVPEADIMNRDSIDYEQKTGTLRLHIKGVDSTYQLDRFNVWVNESPLYGQRGIRIRKKNSNSLDTTITIVLSQGENRIETSITNVNGTESYRMPLYVNYTPAVKQKEMTRFIGIGIDQFKQSNYNLQYSSKDIRDLAVKLKEKYKDNIVIDTLFNENITTEKVKALKEKLKQTTVNDKVIISYSGHGLLSRDYDYYLSTYAVNFSKPEENGLPYDELENLLDSIPARKKLLLIDACHSGEVDKEEGIAMNKTADSLSLSKGIIIDQPQQQHHVGLKNSFELMQSLFVNVGKSTGATIISAAAGNQFALERGDLKNGVFTYSLLEAMNQYPTIKISELKKIVGERVEQLTNGMQKPTSRNENVAVDWSLW